MAQPQRVLYVTPDGVPCDEYGRVLPGAEKQKIQITQGAQQIQGAPLPGAAAAGGAPSPGGQGADMRFVPADGAGGGAPKKDGGGTWSCPACTYQNSLTLKSCAICQSKRPANPSGGGGVGGQPQPQPPAPGDSKRERPPGAASPPAGAGGPNPYSYPSLNRGGPGGASNGGGAPAPGGSGGGAPGGPHKPPVADPLYLVDADGHPIHMPGVNVMPPPQPQPPASSSLAGYAQPTPPPDVAPRPSATVPGGSDRRGSGAGVPSVDAVPPAVAAAAAAAGAVGVPIAATPNGDYIYLDASGGLIRLPAKPPGAGSPPPVASVLTPIPAPAPVAAPPVAAPAPVPTPSPSASVGGNFDLLSVATPAPGSQGRGNAAPVARGASQSNLLLGGVKLACGAAPHCEWVGSTAKARTEHEAVCQRMPVACTFAEFGCDEHHLREQLPVHNRDGAPQHLDLVIARVRSLEAQLSVLTRTTAILKHPAVNDYLQSLTRPPAPVVARKTSAKDAKRAPLPAADGEDDHDNTTNPDADTADDAAPAPVAARRSASKPVASAVAPAAARNGRASYNHAEAEGALADLLGGSGKSKARSSAAPVAAPEPTPAPSAYSYSPLDSSVAATAALVLGGDNKPAAAAPAVAPRVTPVLSTPSKDKSAKRHAGEGEEGAEASGGASPLVTPIVARPSVVAQLNSVDAAAAAPAPAAPGPASVGDLKHVATAVPASNGDSKTVAPATKSPLLSGASKVPAGGVDRSGCQVSWSSTFAAAGAQDGHIQNVVAMAVVGDELFVCDQQNSRVTVFGADDGKYRRKFGDGVLAGPSGMAIDTAPGGTGHVYVSDQLHNRIVVFGADDGKVVFTFPFNAKRARGSNDDGLATPSTNAAAAAAAAASEGDKEVDLNGELSRGPIDIALYGEEVYATDWDNGCVCVFNKRTGASTRQFGAGRMHPEEVSRLSIDPLTGECFVVAGDDADETRAVLVFRAADGSLIGALPKRAPDTRDPATALSTLSSHGGSGVTAGGGDELWMAVNAVIVVVDRTNGNVLRRLNGPRAKWSTPTAFCFDFGSAAAAASGNAVGRLFVAGELHRIYCYAITRPKSLDAAAPSPAPVAEQL